LGGSGTGRDGLSKGLLWVPAILGRWRGIFGDQAVIVHVEVERKLVDGVVDDGYVGGWDRSADADWRLGRKGDLSMGLFAKGRNVFVEKVIQDMVSFILMFFSKKERNAARIVLTNTEKQILFAD